MYGNQLEILAQPIPGVMKEIHIDLYESNPSIPLSQERVDELFSDLKVFINQIPNVTITEDK